jgi:hypothetical protein
LAGPGPLDAGVRHRHHTTDQSKHPEVVQTVLSTQETTNLAPSSIDVAFVCATYHHFEHPKRFLSSIHQALRARGQLVVIDFDLRKDSSDFVRERARAPKEVYFQEIEEVGS